MREAAMLVRAILPALMFVLVVPAPAQQDSRRPKHGAPPMQSHEERYGKSNRLRTSASPVGRPRLGLATPAVFPNVSISNDTFPQNEPAVAISHKHPNRVVAAWRDFRTGVEPAVRRVAHSLSTDGGRTWSVSALLPLPYASIGLTRNSDPSVCTDTAGNFYISTLAMDDNNDRKKFLVYKSVDSGATFGAAYLAPTDTAVAFYDKNYIACDLSPASPYINNLYIVSHGAVFTRSTDGGVSWSSASIVTNPPVGWGPDLSIGKDGSVHVASQWDSVVRFTRSVDGGLSFLPPSVVDSLRGRDGFDVEDGGLCSIAEDISDGILGGSLYVVWADRRFGDLDVFLSVSSNGGDSWSQARRVNDDPSGNGKNQYWPWIAVGEEGSVQILYYDDRNTPDSTISETYLATSWDGGLSFSNVLLSTEQSPHDIPNDAVRFGDYIGIDSWRGRIVSVWTDERAGNFDMDIYTAVIDPFAEFSLTAGWNLVSLPITVADASRQMLFTDPASAAFSYDGGYSPHDTIENGPGYWLKMGSAGSRHAIGLPISVDTFQIQKGWNIIGSITGPIPTNSIASDPEGLVVTNFFGYDGAYVVSDTIKPGHAYWVKASASGELMLGMQGPLGSAVRIVPTDELPPPPPRVDAWAASGPGAFRLEQNYPNPFNPATIIRFFLSEREHVTIKIYDILGREVATLLDGMRDAGPGSATLDARGLSSGVYAYRVRVGDRVESRKMLLMR